MPEPDAPHEPYAPGLTPEEERAAIKEMVTTLATTQMQAREEMLRLLADTEARIVKGTEEKMNKVLDTILEATVKGNPARDTGLQQQVGPGATLTRGAPVPAGQTTGSSVLPPWVQEIRQMLKEFGVIGGEPEGLGISLDGEFKNLANEMQRQAILQLKNDYRRKLGLPQLAEHTQEAGHA